MNRNTINLNETWRVLFKTLMSTHFCPSPDDLPDDPPPPPPCPPGPHIHSL